MGDHFNDYPQTVGNHSSDWRQSAVATKERQKEELATKMAPFHLWKWANYLEDEENMPCRYGADYQAFLPQLEAIVRELFPVARVGRWEVLKNYSLDQVFQRLGLEPIPVQEWEKR